MSSPRRRKQSGSNARRRSTPVRDFWGTEDAGDGAEHISPADDPGVMLRSLNSPPLPGRETVAVHYFVAVAEKAASLAVALAAASDLLDLDGVPHDGDDEDVATA